MTHLVYTFLKSINNKLIQNQEINFSPHYYCELKDGNLSISPNKQKIPANFFGNEVKNITLILGKNGIGKSSVLRSICNSSAGESLTLHQFVGRDYGIYFRISSNIRGGLIKSINGIPVTSKDIKKPFHLGNNDLIFIQNKEMRNNFDPYDITANIFYLNLAPRIPWRRPSYAGNRLHRLNSNFINYTSPERSLTAVLQFLEFVKDKNLNRISDS